MKLHIFIILLLFTQSLSAQEDTHNHNYIIGSTMSFSHQKSNSSSSLLSGIFPGGTSGTRSTSLSLNPYIGKMINSKWTLGLELNYRGSRSERNFTYNLLDKSLQIGGGIFGRYILNPAQQFNIYIQPLVLYNYAHIKSENSISDIRQITKANSFLANSHMGVLYTLNEKFNVTLRIGGVSFAAGYRKVNGNDTYNEYYSSFNANFRLSSLSFGIEFKI